MGNLSFFLRGGGNLFVLGGCPKKSDKLPSPMALIPVGAAETLQRSGWVRWVHGSPSFFFFFFFGLESLLGLGNVLGVDTKLTNPLRKWAASFLPEVRWLTEARHSLSPPQM